MPQIINSLLAQLLPQKALAGWKDQLTEINIDANLPDSSVYDIALSLMQFLLLIFTVLAVLSFVIYGMMFLFAGVNKDSADSARKGVQYSITGIVIGLSGYIIIRFIDELLQGYFSWYF